MRAVVAGAGVAGLASALALARARHDVALIDRDRIDLVGPPAGAFDWIRHGIPHFQQPHAFLPRGRLVLLRHFPDIVSALLEAGADDYDVSGKIPGERHEEDNELIFLSVRRPLIEWALRDAVNRQKGITVVPGAKVTGLRLQKGTPARVTGVTTDGGDCFQADVVVDALGRTSPCAKWITAASAPAVPEDSSDCGLIYYSRYFRLRPGRRFPDGP